MMYYNRTGDAISQEEWISGFRDDEAKRVGLDYVGEVMISTVWLGLDHSFGFGNGPPLIFETMIFDSEDEELDNYQERYSTEERAIEGHERAIALVKGKKEKASVL